MSIQKINNPVQINFGSKNCPIEPFIIQTTKGPLFFRELKPEDTKGIHRSAYFDFYCCLNAFSDWATFYKKATKAEKITEINDIADDYLSKLNKPDGNTTILIGETAKKRVKALFTMENFTEFKTDSVNFTDDKTGHIQECMVDKTYRKEGLGAILLQKIMETAKGQFTDIFLEADNKALSFYKRAGFLSLDTSNPDIKKVSDFILSQRDDRDSITLMSKPLESSNPWCSRLVKCFK